jgi:hypothetical protein
MTHAPVPALAIPRGQTDRGSSRMCRSPSSAIMRSLSMAFLRVTPIVFAAQEPRASSPRCSGTALVKAALPAIQLKGNVPMKIAKVVAATALLACGATLAFAQSTPPSESKSLPGAPEQSSKGPTGTGGAAIGPPADATAPAPGVNPAGVTKEKQKSNQDDPQQGGKKQ